MSNGQPGFEPRESNTAVIVAVVLCILMIPVLFLCGGAAALFWTLRVSNVQPMPFVEAVPVYDSEDWGAAAEAGLRVLESRPDDTLAYLRVAPLLVLAEDEAKYRDFCSRMVEQFAGTDDVQAAERTCKACLLVDGAVELDALPHMALAESLDEGTAPEEIASWLWSARGLVAYRRGDAESAAAYLQKAEETEPLPMAEALLVSLRACVFHQLGQLETSRSSVKQTHDVIDEILKSNPSSARHHDVLIAKIFLQEAEALIEGELAAPLTDTATPADESIEEPQAVSEIPNDDR